MRAGRRQPPPLDEFVEWPCDNVIYALGTQANPIVGRATPGLTLDARGFIAADGQTQATSLPGVFAGGDIVTGGATVIPAMAPAAARAGHPPLAAGRGAEWPAGAGAAGHDRRRRYRRRGALPPALNGARTPCCAPVANARWPTTARSYICAAGAHAMALRGLRQEG